MQEFKRCSTVVVSSYASCQGHQSDIICRKRKGLVAASSKRTLFLHLLLFAFFSLLHSVFVLHLQLNFAFHEPYASLAGWVAAAESVVARVPSLSAAQQSAVQHTRLPWQSRVMCARPSTCRLLTCAHLSWRGGAGRSGGVAAAGGSPLLLFSSESLGFVTVFVPK